MFSSLCKEKRVQSKSISTAYNVLIYFLFSFRKHNFSKPHRHALSLSTFVLTIIGENQSQFFRKQGLSYRYSYSKGYTLVSKMQKLHDDDFAGGFFAETFRSGIDRPLQQCQTTDLTLKITSTTHHPRNIQPRTINTIFNHPPLYIINHQAISASSILRQKDE